MPGTRNTKSSAAGGSTPSRKTKRKASAMGADPETEKRMAASSGKTKKQLREEAILRAKQSMKADKEKVEAVKKAKTASPAKSPTASARKKPRVSKDSMISTPKNSKKASKAAAVKRAQEWGAKDREELEKKKTPSPRKTTPIAAKPDATVAAPAPMGMGMAAGGIDPQIMAQFMQQQMQHNMQHYAQQQAAAGLPMGSMMGYGTMHPSYAMAQQTAGHPYGQYGYPSLGLQSFQAYPQAGMGFATPEATPIAPTPSTRKTSTPSVSASKKSPKGKLIKGGNDDDDILPPPPLQKLEMQISQQVMANVSASLKNEPTPFNEPPPEAYGATSVTEAEENYDDSAPIDDQPIIVDDLPGSNEPLSQSRTDKKTTWSLVVVACLCVLAAVAISIVQERVRGHLTCFLDSKPRYLDGQLVSPCKDHLNPHPCPQHGHCQDGHLTECIPKDYQVNMARSACELIDKTREAVNHVRNVLIDLSIQAICNNGNHVGTSPIVFDYNDLQVDPIDADVLETEFFVVLKDDKVHIGLQEDYPLRIPMSCQMQQGVKASLRSVGKWVLDLLGSFTHIVWSSISAYPIISIIGLVAMWVARRGRIYQQKRAQLVVDVARVREMAFAKLSEDTKNSHAILHIRDEIVAELTSGQDVLSGARRQRLYWNKEVWPRVVPQLQMDNRIHNSQRVSQGKAQDYWQWIASAKKAPRQS